MSQDEFSRGVDLIASRARDHDLALGSRFLDFSRGVVRLSFEKSVEVRGRRQMRTPTFEFSREYIEDQGCLLTKEHLEYSWRAFPPGSIIPNHNNS